MAEDSFAAGLLGVVLDGRYRLDALLGEGGMGAVFRATHLAMDRRVAIKLLKPHLTSDDTALQRFAREARATLKVDSPHAVKVLDFGITPQRDCYIALEYLDGRTVQRELEVDGAFAPARVVHIAKQALHALGAAHRHGLVHRDIKPDNLLLMRAGDDPDFTKVLDFGVAKLMEGTARSAQSALALTQAGMVFGTPEFMSPEQACGRTLDGRSDLYSLAATMFAMLTGCGMYAAQSAIEWLTHHARTPPPHLVDGRLDLAMFPELDAVLQRCLAKSRDDRPATAEEMASLLASVEPTLSRTPGQPAGAPARAMRAAAASPSSYIAALSPEAMADPGATLLPGAPPAPAIPPAGPAPAIPPAGPAAPDGRPDATPARPAHAPTLLATGDEAPSTTAVVAAVRGRRGTWLLAGALAVAGALAAAVAIAARGGKASPAAPQIAAKQADATPSPPPELAAAPPSPQPELAAAHPELAAAPRDAAGPANPAPTDAARAAAPPAADARPAAAHAGHHPHGVHHHGVDPRVRAEIARHVAASEQARAAGNPLAQLAEADAALRLDPGHARARYLAADALLKSHDLDNGCRYLRMLTHSATARARAHQAGCPGS